MASTPRVRITPRQLSADREVLITLKTLEDYSPTNPAARLEALQQLEATLARAEEARLLAMLQYKATIEAVYTAQAALHRAILIAKEQVIGQYGGDSPAVHAVGRKQKSERKRPARRVSEAV